MIRRYTKQPEYIKADNNKILNASCIKWVKKMDECMEICMKGDGCYIGDTSRLCKINNPESYEKLNKHFE
jgi:hypothetical protein